MVLSTTFFKKTKKYFETTARQMLRMSTDIGLMSLALLAVGIISLAEKDPHQRRMNKKEASRKGGFFVI
ncbi:MAG: hypothetical protein J6T17_00160 [Clostridia bacterium]|nr:hypothetical protein [Clostridia bacterium]